MAKFILSAFADEAGGGLLSQIEALKSNGLTHIEPRGLDEGNISAYTAEQARAVKKILDEHGVGVSSIGSYFGKIGIGDDFAPHFEEFRQLCIYPCNCHPNKVYVYEYSSFSYFASKFCCLVHVHAK